MARVGIPEGAMKSLEELLREAFERERIREEADPSIPVRRAAMLKRLDEIERCRAEEAEKLPKAEADRAKAARARLLYFQGTRSAPIPVPAPRSGKLVDPSRCPHLQTNYGHCDLCGESVVDQHDSVVWYRRKHG